MIETPNRLDRIEATLERLIGVVGSNRGDIELLVDATRSSRQDIELLSDRIGQLAQQVSELRQGQFETIASIDLLVQTMTQFQQQSVADHAVTLENQAQIRRIWEYLMRENSNGRGGQG